jgi:hypothetical protein
MWATFRQMNNLHKKVRTIPLGRVEMNRRIVEESRPVAEVAAGFGISERRAREPVLASARLQEMQVIVSQ